MRRTFTLVTALVTLCALGPAASARVAGACDAAGMYTDRLCPQGHMLNGTYLVSPNERYRFYYSGGTARVYDVGDWNNWVLRYELLPAHDNPGYLMYGHPGAPGLPPMNVVAYNSDNNFITGFGIFPADADGRPVGEHFMRLENDGCFRWYDQDGNRWITTLCG
jgi:hypothetical protein